MTTVGVVIPSYGRPRDLVRCLESLSAQTLSPRRTVVVARLDDDATMRAARSLHAEVVIVDRPGQVAALNRGLQALTDVDVVAIFDDDVVVGAEWLAGAASAFARHPDVGGVGGRERLVSDGAVVSGTTSRRIGSVSWFGRSTGLFHLAAGATTEAEHLKGCAMAYRSRAIDGLRFDERLAGAGAQPFNDTAFSLAVRRRGWRLLLLADIAVDHIHGARLDPTPRQLTGPIEVQNHNETVTILDHMPAARRPVALAWLILVGSIASPGILQLIRSIPSRRWSVVTEGRAAMRGRLTGCHTWLSTRADRPR